MPSPNTHALLLRNTLRQLTYEARIANADCFDIDQDGYTHYLSFKEAQALLEVPIEKHPVALMENSHRSGLGRRYDFSPLTGKLAPDVAEYLMQATIEVANLEGYVPESPDEFRIWMEEHSIAIGRKAIEMQWELLNKISRPGVSKALSAVLSTRTWLNIRVENLRAEANQAIADTLASIQR